jgi:hypothetical protein
MRMLSDGYGALLGAVFNLNHPAHTLDWEFIHLSVANVVVIGLMLIVFALAILVPFPGAARRAQAREAAASAPGASAAEGGASTIAADGGGR